MRLGRRNPSPSTPATTLTLTAATTGEPSTPGLNRRSPRTNLTRISESGSPPGRRPTTRTKGTRLTPVSTTGSARRWSGSRVFNLRTGGKTRREASRLEELAESGRVGTARGTARWTRGRARRRRPPTPTGGTNSRHTSPHKRGLRPDVGNGTSRTARTAITSPRTSCPTVRRGRRASRAVDRPATGTRSPRRRRLRAAVGTGEPTAGTAAVSRKQPPVSRKQPPVSRTQPPVSRTQPPVSRTQPPRRPRWTRTRRRIERRITMRTRHPRG